MATTSSPGNADRPSHEFQAALDCYLSAISGIAEHALPAGERLVRQHRKNLEEMQRQICEQPTAGVLNESRRTLNRELRNARQSMDAIRDQGENELREALCLLAETVKALVQPREPQSRAMHELADRVEAASLVTDLGEIRKSLVDLKAGLTKCADAMRLDRSSTGDLSAETVEFRQRLEAAEALASTDPLTGIANRREGEWQMERNITSGNNFSAVIFDLEHFKAVNDRWGHQCGDKVLKLFAKRLAERVRSQDTVCRWGGDEFLVVLGCDLGDAISRASQLADSCTGTYDIDLEGRVLKVPIRVSVGVAEYRPGETARSLFARADALLYEQKSAREAQTLMEQLTS